jgi:hypothetical protein
MLSLLLSLDDEEIGEERVRRLREFVVLLPHPADKIQILGRLMCCGRNLESRVSLSVNVRQVVIYRSLINLSVTIGDPGRCRALSRVGWGYGRYARTTTYIHLPCFPAIF